VRESSRAQRVHVAVQFRSQPPPQRPCMQRPAQRQLPRHQSGGGGVRRGVTKPVDTSVAGILTSRATAPRRTAFFGGGGVRLTMKTQTDACAAVLITSAASAEGGTCCSSERADGKVGGGDTFAAANPTKSVLASSFTPAGYVATSAFGTSSRAGCIASCATGGAAGAGRADAVVASASTTTNGA
jgi:hypothetical protein